VSAPQAQPLAALLASHPSEVEAVLCALTMHGRDMLTPLDIASEISCYGRREPIPNAMIVRISVVLGIAGIVKVSVEGCGHIEGGDRYAIARMGAAAWLAARVTGSGDTGAGAPAKGEQR